MKKQIKYKKFIIIFGAVLIFIPVVWFTLTAIFPLPPERKLTVTENKIHIDELIYARTTELYYDAYISPFSDNTFAVAVMFEYDDESNYSKLYHINADGTIINSLNVPYSANNIFVLENGNIAALDAFSDDDTYGSFIYEYTPDFEFVSKKEFSEPVYGHNYRANYHNGEFYINDAEGVTVFDGDLNVVKRYPVEGPENARLTFARTYDGEPYLFLTKPVKPKSYFSYYYFRPLDGDEYIQIDVPPSLLFSIAYGLTPGDSEYPLYGDLWGYGYWSELMNYDFDGHYVVGLNMDGSYDKILLDNMSFYAAVPAGGKRYSVKEESEHVEANTYKLDLYLCEYTAVYED